MGRITCWFVRRRLGAYRDGELSPAAETRVTTHLAGCLVCAAEVRVLAGVQANLRTVVPDLPEADWNAFWPHVRARLAQVPPNLERTHPPRRLWGAVSGSPRFAIGTVLAVAAVGVIAVWGPWATAPEPPVQPGAAARVAAPSGPATRLTMAAPARVQQVVVQAVETTDPRSSAMVFMHPGSDDTVVWVFGLEPTEI